MFTGIITDVGSVLSVETPGIMRLVIGTDWDTASIAIGASIACNGVCLTAVHVEPGRFVVEASAETLARTTLADWRPGTLVNLERSLRLGDELGGHFVFGHVDAVATIATVRPEGESRRITVDVPAALACYVVEKGSVALDGVSLTVNEIDGTRFGVNIIPHTLTWTSFHTFEPGRRVNCEIDMLARYVRRMMPAGLS